MKQYLKILFFALLPFLNFGQSPATATSTKAVIDGALPDNNTKGINATTLRGTMKAIVDFTDTKAGSPNVIVGNSGKTVAIKSTVTYTPTIVQRIEVDPVVITTIEDQMDYQDFHGYQLFQRNYNMNLPTSDQTLLTGIREVWRISGTFQYVQNGKTINNNLETMVVVGSPIIEFLATSNSVIVRDFNCSPCTSKKLFFNIKYTKQ